MFKNVKAKKRLTQVLVAFMVICMSVTGSFLLLDDAVVEASAEAIEVTDDAQLYSALKGITSGDNKVIKVATGSYDLGTYAELYTIPADATVELYLAAGAVVYWDREEASSQAIMDTSYPVDNRFFGLITNNGTLTLTGSGYIRMKQVSYNYEHSDRHDEYIQRVATIVNASSGTLTVGSGITIESYIGQANSSGNARQRMYLYSMGIYNEGILNSSGNINSGSFAGGTTAASAVTGASEKFSDVAAFSYGIFSSKGTTNVSGGNINANAYSGYLMDKGNSYNNVYNYAVGIYANNAVILGDTNIKTYATSWRDRDTSGADSGNPWKNGRNESYSTGVMYSGENYPVLGASVDIDAVFQMIAGSTQVRIPGTNLAYSDCQCKDGSDSAYRVGCAVIGVSANATNAMYGAQGSYVSANGIFGTPTSHRFWGEYPYRLGNLTNASMTDATGNLQTNTTTGDDMSDIYLESYFRDGAPGTGGTQYVIVYRYYKDDVLVSTSYTHDASRVNGAGTIKIAGTADTNVKGTVADAKSLIAYNGGGVTKNEYYYSTRGVTIEGVNNAIYAKRKIDNVSDWKTAGTTLATTGTAMAAGQTFVIYFSYNIEDADIIRIASSNNTMSNFVTSKSFSVVYTGAEIVPGKDFKLGIFTIGKDSSEGTNSDTTDDENITSRYNVSGSDTSKKPIVYSYSADGGTNYISGLPKNVGSYLIKVSIAADTTFAESGTYNCLGKEDILTCTITQATPEIDGVTAITEPYGKTYNQLIDTNSFTVTGAAGESVKNQGTFSFVNLDGADYPDATVHTVTVKWTPAAGSEVANNYKPTTHTITLTITKVDVTVTVAPINVEYGAEVPKLAVTYAGLASADQVAVSTGGIESVKGLTGDTTVSTDYVQGAVVGDYPIYVSTTLNSTNYNFTSEDSKIVVGKRALKITANNKEITYGDGAPAYDYVVEGLYGKETLKSLGYVVDASSAYALGSDAGYYDINLSSGNVLANYEVEFVSGMLTVDRAVLTVTPNAAEVEYGASAPAFKYTVTGFKCEDDESVVSGSPSYTHSYVSGSDVGSYEITADVRNMSATNYTFTGATGVLSVTRTDPEVSGVTATVVNTYSLADAVINAYTATNKYNAVLAPTGEIVFEDTSIVPSYGVVSTYKATFIPDDTDNYNSVECYVNVTVTELQISGAPVVQGSTMEGQTLTANLSSMNPDAAQYYSYRWYYGDGSLIATAKSQSYTLTDADIGKTIYVEVTAIQEGFTGSAKSEVSPVIIEALKAITQDMVDSGFFGVVGLSNSIVYDAKEHAASVYVVDTSVAQFVGDITVKYNGSSAVPVDAGTYYVTFDVAAPAEPAGGYTTDYYGPAVGLEVGTITITQREFKVTVAVEDKVYNGTIAATATGATSTGAVEGDKVGIAGYKVAFADANAGENKKVNVTGVTLTGEDAPNYKVVVNECTATITPRPFNVTAYGVSRQYNGSAAVEVTFTVDSSTYAPIDNAAKVYIKNNKGTAVSYSANAGTWLISNIQATLGGTSAGNYVVNVTNLGTAFVIITKADVPGVVFPHGATVQFGYDLTHVEFAYEGLGDGKFEFENASITVPENIGYYEDEYKVIFTPTDSRNYNSQETYIDLTVVKCVLDYLVGVAGTPEVGQTLRVVTTGLPSVAGNYMLYQWYRVGEDSAEAINGATSSTYIATEEDVDCTLYVVTYFDLQKDPFVYAETAVLETLDDIIYGIVGQSEDTIDEIKLTFWQRILNWIRRIIEAITGATLMM